MISLRDYQKNSLRRVSEAYANGAKSVCYVLPTGAGKTVCVAYAASQHVKTPNRHVIFIAHREELISQAASKMREFGLKTRTFVSGKMSGPVDADVTVAMVQSLQKTDDFRCKPTLVVFDEGHHAPADSYQFVKSRLPDNAKFLFVTATPERADGRPMGDCCDALIVGCQLIDLINLNREQADQGLVDCRVYTTDEKKRPGIHAQLAGEALLERASNDKAVIFAPTVEYSLSEVEFLNSKGIKAAHIDGKTPVLTRKILLDKLKTGELQVISNVNLLTEGWDLPALQTAVLARACTSTALWLQICGRVMRPFAGKTYGKLLDLTGSFWLHGLPSEDREYSLTGKAIKIGRSDDTLPPHYRCRQCFLIFDRRSNRYCPNCGEEIKNEKTKLQIKNEKLTEITAMQASNRKRGDDWLYEQLKRYGTIAKNKQYNIFWAVKRVEIITGVKPSKPLVDKFLREMRV